MSSGELLTRLTIWLALGGYVIGAGMLLFAQHQPRWRLRARWAWTFGCAFFVAHVVCAFSSFHHWSHAEAYRETARQTGEMTGIHWGGGLFLNYLFGVAWLADVSWWWLAPESLARRSSLLAGCWHGFAFFMVFNGTVVFGNGPVRWFGLLISASLLGLWMRKRNLESSSAPPVS
ncbi:MAG TPA: hypothetical protein VGO90_05965 [Chthoniobacteraceae bacterium]|jgi:hypothetical protein|nr:hypothetical protein [Chthoniobacteraceae bacterium]